MFGIGYPKITHGNIASAGRYTSGDARGLRKVTIVKQIKKSKTRIETKTIKCAMTDDKLENVMDKMDAKGPGVLSEFEHKGIYGDVEAFRERNPEWKLSNENSEGEEADNEKSGILGDVADTSKPEMDPVEKIKKIMELLDEGIISEEEFQEKKSELLDEM